MRRVPVPLRGAGDAAALLAQLLPGLRARVPGLGAAPAAGAGAGPGPGPGPGPGAAPPGRAGPGPGPGAGSGSGRGPGAVPAVQEAQPPAPRRRGRAARQHHAGGGGEAVPLRSGRGARGAGPGAGAGAGAGPAGAEGHLPEAPGPPGAALLPHVPPRRLRAVRVRGAPGHLPLRQPAGHGVPGGESKRSAPRGAPPAPCFGAWDSCVRADRLCRKKTRSCRELVACLGPVLQASARC